MELFISILQLAEPTCLPQSSLHPRGNGARCGLPGLGLSAERETRRRGGLDTGEAHLSGGVGNAPRKKQVADQELHMTSGDLPKECEITGLQVPGAELRPTVLSSSHPTPHPSLSAQGRPVHYKGPGVRRAVRPRCPEHRGITEVIPT